MRDESGPDAKVSISHSAGSEALSPHARAARRLADAIGFVCLIASLLLMSLGVRTARADGEALRSVDPVRVEAERQKAVAKSAPVPVPAPSAQRPGVPAIEAQPGVIVLNTRGYNYGPPPAAIDPAAMRVEKGVDPAP
jgi:hypothetical protein